MYYVFSHCKHCAKEMVQLQNKVSKYCSKECHLAYERENTKTKHGFMTNLIARQREGQVWKGTWRNVDSM